MAREYETLNEALNAVDDEVSAQSDKIEDILAALAIKAGGSLPNVRKFQVTTDASLGTYGGVSFAAITEGRANYLIMNTDPTHMNSADRYVRAIGVAVDYNYQTKATAMSLARYDMLGSLTLTASINDGILTVLGDTTRHMEHSYSMDVYEVKW